MIAVENLTKQFGNIVAVDNLSFNIEKGEIVGLLGPNGAGKTTTMRLLTCFVPATSGTASVAGHDIFADSLGVRNNVGYMPEDTPLYPEMRVKEYLAYRAALKSISVWQRRKRVEQCIERCAVKDVQRQIVGTLSKGYRQRVALADALLASPPVLILDEPTSGLDPNQIRETRNLVRELAQDRTVMISSHILPEVEATCQRVLIINKGRIVADDTPQDLSTKLLKDMIVVEIRGPAKQVAAALKALAGVSEVNQTEGGDVPRFEVRTKKGEDIRESVFRCAVEKGWTLREIYKRRASLEDVFAAITQSEEQTPDE